MSNPFHAAVSAASELKTRFDGAAPVAVVLGSGWASVAEGLGQVVAAMPLDEIPGIPAPTVPGHGGTVSLVERPGGRRALVFAGRSHLYEGHPVDTVVHTARTAVLAGCERIILTNACGSLDRDLGVGAPVLLSDQLNLTGANPMCGDDPPAGFPIRFCDLTNLYSPTLRSVALEWDPALRTGVYAGVLGGSFETPAEIHMLRTLGADLVGMSTVLESIAAKHLGAEVAGVSLVTNLAAGMAGELSHAEVLETGQASASRLIDLIGVLVDA